MTDKQFFVDTKKFDYVITKLRNFFKGKGYLEAHLQNRLSILSACEDVSSISTFNYTNTKYPLPQTSQMWLEYELLKNPEPPGYFSVATSYRNEPNPIPGRHDLIFPMFEFELKGDIHELENVERELLEYLGYGAAGSFPAATYGEVSKKYDAYDIGHDEEQRLYRENGSVFFLTEFPEYTSPFWNMKRNKTNMTSNKIDVILSGMETIGSAERSGDVNDMRNRFNNISNGMYAKTLYNHFGKERVDNELEEFFNLNFIIRSGGGIGITRLITSMEKEGLLFK
jgi:aspartyl/asparaginyl-tRNA synthetase